MMHTEMEGANHPASPKMTNPIAEFNDSFTRLYQAEEKLAPILGSVGKDTKVVPPLNIDTGKNIFFGDGVHINVATTIHDKERVSFGDRVLTGPYLQINTVEDGRSGEVEIGDDVWIGGGVKVKPGSKIGSGSVVAAGSIVDGEIPPNVLVVGFPAKVIKELNPNQPSRYEHLKEEPGRQRMVSGETFYTSAPDLVKDKQRAYELFRALNHRGGTADSSTEELKEAFKRIGDGTKISLPFYWSYGYQVEIGSSVEMGEGVFLGDGGLISIGDGAKIGNRVQVYTTNHLPEKSERAFISTKGVSIGKDVQIGDDVIILPGITIGDNVIVEPGSVVTHDIPEGTRVAGLPAKQV